MSKLKYLVLTDLDGTLLKSNGEISNRTKDYVHALNERDDILFSFSTGRHWKDAENVYKELNLKGFVSCCNGAYILNPHTGEARYSFVSDSLWDAMIESEEFFKDYLGGTIMTDKGDFFLVPDNRVEVTGLMRGVNAKIFCIRIHFERRQGEYDSVDSRINNRLIFLKSLIPSPNVAPLYYPEFIALEVLPNYACKERAVEFMSNYYGIAPENILTFGDEINDISVALGISRSIAVRNAVDLFKQRAKHLSKFTNNEDSVIEEIEIFLKNNS